MRSPTDRHFKPEHPDAHVLQRAVAIGLVRRGATCADAAREVGFTREAVREWNDDRAGLLRRGRLGGSPRMLSDDEIELLDDLLDGREAWRLSELRRVVAARLDRTLSLDALMNMLRLLGYETKHLLWFRTPERVPFREQRAAARVRNEAAARERVAAIAAHMRASGFTIDEIVGLLEECGAKGPSGRPLRRAEVTRILASRARSQGR